MNTVNTPGFTAERSIYSTNGQFQTVAFDAYVSDAEVRLQKFICHHDGGGNIICTDTACRVRCLHTKKGAALQACLDDC